MSANQQNAFAGAFNDAIFNSWRRFSRQVLYVAPPLVFFYYAMSWATERYENPSPQTTSVPLFTFLRWDRLRFMDRF